jgi:tetratricopeptide (TPR) repeat protein
MSKRWQKVEIRYLEKHAGKKSVEELAERFHTDAATVEAKLRALRLDGRGGAEGGSEPELLSRYQEGMAALYEGRWQEADDILTEVAERSAQPELAARARQFAERASRQAARPDDEDPYLRAVFDKNRGALDTALATCFAGGRLGKDGRYAYLAAAVECLRGELDKSSQHLRKAFELDPGIRGQARRDPDLEPLRRSPDHRELFRE